MRRPGHLVVQEVEALRGAAASPSRRSCAGRTGRGACPGRIPALRAASMNFADSPRKVSALGGSDGEEPVERGVAGVAVVQHDAGTAAECAEQPVPHHPAARREVEDAVPRTDVQVIALLAQDLQEHPGRRVDDALRPARRAAREQDEARVRERQGHGRQVAAAVRGEPLIPRQGVLVRCAAHDDDGPDGRQARDDLRQPGQAVDRGAPVLVPAREHQHLGTHLAEPVDHAGRTEVGRSGADDGPDRQGAEGVGGSLDRVGRPRGDAVPSLDPRGGQGARHGGDLVAKLRPRQLAAATVLEDPDQDHVLAGSGHQGVDDVQAGVGEEPGAEEALARHGAAAGISDDPEVVPGLAPEGGGLLDGPVVQGREVGGSVPGLQAGHEARPRDPFVRPPHRRVHIHASLRGAGSDRWVWTRGQRAVIGE